MVNTIALAIHGGAGTITRGSMTAEMQQAYEAGLSAALEAGYDCLEQGGTALDAVETAVAALEDNILFNAGRGAVFNHSGGHEMDAAIMNGSDLAAGAVAGITGVKNPVKVARSVMENSGHVLLSGAGADRYAEQQGFEQFPETYFYSEQRYQQWQDALKEDAVVLDHTEKKFGTVGAVALDSMGNMAAATSTGGMTNKRFGRVGDTPIIGAGTYAKNATCAVSCTGHGELFMRAVVAHDISCLMQYKGSTLEEAAKEVVMEKLVAIAGEGGLIALDAAGNITMPFNSEGMYRACKTSKGRHEVKIYKD